MSEQITVALPFFSLVVSLATLGWSVRLWRRQNEIEAEAAARLLLDGKGGA